MRSFFIRTSVAKESWIYRATHEERRRRNYVRVEIGLASPLYFLDDELYLI